MMGPAFQYWWSWVWAFPWFVVRVPVTILGAVFIWCVLWWMISTLWPWVRLIFKVIGKLLGKVADALEFLPRKSDEASRLVERLWKL